MVDTHHQETNRDLMRLQHRALHASLVKFQSPSTRRSIIQLTSTALAYAATVAGMYAALQFSVWLTLAMSLPAAGLVVRLFIIQHDCSYFRSSYANEIDQPLSHREWTFR